MYRLALSVDWSMGGIAIDPYYLHEFDLLYLAVKCAPEFSWEGLLYGTLQTEDQM